MRLALLTSPGAQNAANMRRMHALAKALADEGHEMVQLPAPHKRRAIRQRIIGVVMPEVDVPEGGYFPWRAGARHLPWAFKAAHQLEKFGPFDAVITVGPGAACAAAATHRFRTKTRWIAYVNQGPRGWRLSPLYRADRLLMTHSDLTESAKADGIPAERIQEIPPFYDPEMTRLNADKKEIRKQLNIPKDRFVSAVLGDARGGRGALVAEVSAHLRKHGTFLTLLPPAHIGGSGMRIASDGYSHGERIAAADVIWYLPEDRGQSIAPQLVDALASGRPILMLAEAESPAANLLNAAEGGMLLSPHDGPALRVATFGMWADQALSDKMGGLAQAYMERRYSAHALAKMLGESILT